MVNNILVTGGLGFVGSHTCAKLIEKGHNIYILDSLDNSSIKVLKNLEQIQSIFKKSGKGFIKFFKGDIRDSNLLDKIFKYSKFIDFSIDYVFHFAGLKSVYESTILPETYFDVNVMGTKILINIMDKNNCKNLVFSSSATIYGDTGVRIIDENFKINPLNNYGKTKVIAEEALYKKFSTNEDWRIIILRYFNPIGAHKSGLIGEESNVKFSNLFPLLCKVANREIINLKIFGKDWDTRDGTCIRDFIHIMDIAEGHLAALDYMHKNNPNFIPINLGTSNGTTILELIKTFEKSTNKKINYIYSERREGDVASYVASNSKAMKYLSWSPSFKLNEMCVDGWNWYLKNKS